MLKIMPADPLQLFLTMFAMIGGLMIFALLLLAGVAIVRWLKLPQELPEGPRFEPPPPPTVAHGNRAQAAVVAASQATLRMLYDQAHQAARAAFETQELHQFANTAGTGEKVNAITAITSRCAATALTAGTMVEQTLTTFDQQVRTQRATLTDAGIVRVRAVIDSQLIIIQSALTEARSAVQPLGDGQGNRRLIILVVLLVVMIAWVIAMQSMMRP
jgi:hypothetical protein